MVVRINNCLEPLRLCILVLNLERFMYSRPSTTSWNLDAEDEDLAWDRLSDRLKALKQEIEKIEKEFKNKGEIYHEEPAKFIHYIRKGGLFFNAEDYYYKIRSSLFHLTSEVIDALYMIFPYIPKDEIKKHIGAISSYIVNYYPASNVVGFAIHYKKGIFGLIDLCENLNDPDTVYELQKPLYVALAYILGHSKESFSITYFKEIRREILQSALSLGLENGWIEDTDSKGVYKVKSKPEAIMITCPNCGGYLNAYENRCPRCKLYILNMIMNEMKENIDDIPNNYYLKNSNNWIAYFCIENSNGEIEIDEYTSIDLYYDVITDVLDKATKLKTIRNIPNYVFFAKYYSRIFDFITELYKQTIFYKDSKYYEVEGESVKEVQQKLKKIQNLLKKRIEVIFAERVEHLPKRFGKRENFVNFVLKTCYNFFEPKLDEHPIFKVRECPRCRAVMPNYARYCGFCGTRLPIS